MNLSPTPADVRIRVVGVGNLLRSDDGVGIHALRELARFPWPPCVEFIDAGSGGLDVLYLLDDASAVCLLDAMRLGEPPGTLYHFAQEAVRFLEAAAQVSLHGLGLSTALALGERLELRPALYLAGIEPYSLEFGERLSPVVQSRLPELVEVVRRKVMTWCETSNPTSSSPLADSSYSEGSGIHGV